MAERACRTRSSVNWHVVTAEKPPATYEDKMLFREQQRYMYAVFVRVLKTEKGKAIVRKYKGIFDAQSIYQEIQEYASKSTQAIVNANTLLQYITIASPSDGSWNGMTRHFVLHWMDQVQLYEELVDISAALSDSAKVALLTNAVRGHTKLSGVYTVAIQFPSSETYCSSGNMLTGQQGSKSGNKSSNTSSSALPSNTNPSKGKRVLNNWLRSIIMSREAFSLFHGFNPNNSSFYSIKEAIVAQK